MVELTGFEQTLFDIKRKKVNQQIKEIIRYGKLTDSEDKINAAIRLVEIYLGKYLKLCATPDEALELVSRVTILRQQRMKVKKMIATQAYAYSTQK